MITIEEISLDSAKELCELITADLPEYFGLEQENEYYAMGVKKCINFAAKSGANYVGMISIDFPYSNNSNIYWLGVLKNCQNQGIGKQLVQAANNFALEKNVQTMTVETLAPLEEDQNYFKTYKFYESMNFRPLFNLKPKNYSWNMVYMIKVLQI